MAVPYTFATATSSIPLSQLDSNFATGITLGNTTVYLGNTTTSFGNVTLTNATISSVAATFPNSFLANSSVTLGTTNVSLGGTATTLANLTLSNVTISGGTSTATQNLANVTGTLAVGNGGTGLTTLTSGYIPYGNGTSAFSSSANLYFSGTNLGLGTSTPSSYANYSTFSINGTTGGEIDFYSGGSLIGSMYNNSSSLLFNTNGAYPIIFNANSSEKMRLTSAGYLGIGTSSPAVQLQVNGGGETPAQTNQTVRIFSSDSLAANKGGSILFGGVYTGSSIAGWAGIAGLKNNSTDGDYGAYLGFYTRANGSGIAETMRLDSSGNLGLGVTPSAWSGSWKAIDVNGVALASDGSAGVHVSSNAYWSGSSWIYKTSAAAEDYYQSSGTHVWRYAPSGTAGNAITFTQAMTLDNSGNLLVGTTSTFTTGSVNAAQISSSGVMGISTTSDSPLYISRRSTDGGIVTIRRDTTQVGSISVTTTATAYNTSSDQRLKENIVDAPSGNIDQIKVRSFDWKADGSHQEYGMVAQELLEVAPYAVHQPTNPDEMMGVDYSKLVPMMIKEIQDLKAEVNQLKQKLGV